MAGLDEALDLIERIAPEHLQLVGRDAEVLALHVRAAGAIFIGAATPEVFGDYVAGPSHVLPTCGSARFASSLGVEDFLRRSHTIRFTPVAASHRAAAAAALADVEGLPGARRGGTEAVGMNPLFPAPKGRHLNSLGRKPQVGVSPIPPSPEGATHNVPAGFTWGSRPRLFKCRPFGAGDGVARRVAA